MRKDQWSELTEGKGQRVGWIPNNPNGLQTRQIPAKREPNSLVNQLYLGKELFLPLSLLINQGYPNECTVIWGWTGTSPPPQQALRRWSADCNRWRVCPALQTNLIGAWNRVFRIYTVASFVATAAITADIEWPPPAHASSLRKPPLSSAVIIHSPVFDRDGTQLMRPS